MTAYTTSEEHLPEDPNGEVTLQVTDGDTKEIFTTRAYISQDPEELADPESLTIVRGPHESVEEEWFIEIIETEINEIEIDQEVLSECIKQSKENSNVVNARSDEVRALLLYLVETNRYGSVSEAVRGLLEDHLADHYPDLVNEYVDIRTELEREELSSQLGGNRNK
ncbi:hypothetical protein [Haladaptatus caseinilyticus]|uniref:hypothetical protein n=1 Tax=Haladaptatus caseinilyticus TaxID=2993314 RepID=UPI00224B4E0C|nr:hypothetical protein [Haladaptatus caseinilyticus]